MTTRLIEVSNTGSGIATITLSWPERRNALSIAMRDQISDALDDLAKDETLKVVVLTGSGSVFSAGFDLREFSSDDPDVRDRLWPSSDRFHHTVLRFPLPVVAGINGPALAGGFDLAVLCDIRIASTAATFAHPEQAFSDVVYGPLHDLVGGAAARYLAMTGYRIDAEEALRIGLVSEVCIPELLSSRLTEVATDIARAPREALIRTKAKVLRRLDISSETPTLDL
ncbi:enoyl-CoA hydratase/isomerase family protein [Smaragdicoccus niigatensis]|uniref:enoyl-CoA hydratase/isomerase family protein n=1 Tax=Smaragdicoccus niigatensis TaxID=359359 RepID=UPI0003737469|nr:enoyl-CoA hydratase/isomerase family protein [Smaragdicoccus niigatensis]